MIYLDNAATTFPKPKSVIKTATECISKYCGNSGRGSHKLSIKTSEKIYEVRERIAGLVGINTPENVVFTQNATHALNIAIKTTVEPNSHVLISDLEHNSVLRPLHALKCRIGIEYSIFSTNGNVKENIEKCIKENTSCIISTLASNVIGRQIPFSTLSEISLERGIPIIIDASQLIGHKALSLENIGPCILCAPSHKALFGIQGSGFLIFNDGKKHETLFEGGSGNDSLNPDMPDLLPERFEAGTLSAPSIISLGAGIKFVEETGFLDIEEKLCALTDKCASAIDAIKNTVLYEYGNGVISFNIIGVPGEVVASELDKYGICVRSGLHCAPLAHKSIGTVGIGTVRVSLSYLNKIHEIDTFYKALKCISNIR